MGRKQTLHVITEAFELGHYPQPETRESTNLLTAVEVAIGKHIDGVIRVEFDREQAKHFVAFRLRVYTDQFDVWTDAEVCSSFDPRIDGVSGAWSRLVSFAGKVTAANDTEQQRGTDARLAKRAASELKYINE